MRNWKTISLALALFAFPVTTLAAPRGGEACREAEAAAKAASAKSPGTIELAICLDTSGSMNGLIDAARTKIWDVVSDLALATPTPKLRVALLTYGNDGLNAENGWTNIETDFTDNLDVVSQKLFALTTNGGTEYVGRVVDKAAGSLAWSKADESLKIIVVAGNESADQDPTVKYADACKKSIERGIVVNSIYCGGPTDDVAPGWKNVAQLADGHFATIDKDNGTVVVATPYDAELVELSAKLNTTYIAFGAAGEWNSANQTMQDRNALGSSSSVAAQRCVTKGGAVYDNRGWDLVDACKQADFKLESVKDEELPEAMRGKTLEEKKAYVAERTKERDAIQARVTELGSLRAKFVADEIAKRAGGDAASFDRAIRDAIRAQATARGFQFPADPVKTAAAPAGQSGAATPVGAR
ncbi:MAG: vWA domain-containing protein [Phycisphaerales bacterium]